MRSLLAASLLLVAARTCTAWTAAQLEVYDLVEEIGENFYELMGISQVCLLAGHVLRFIASYGQ